MPQIMNGMYLHKQSSIVHMRAKFKKTFYILSANPYEPIKILEGFIFPTTHYPYLVSHNLDLPHQSQQTIPF